MSGAIGTEFASLAHWKVAGLARHGFEPFVLCRVRAKDEGENLSAAKQIRTQPSGNDTRPCGYGTGPAVKTSNPRLSPRGAGLRRWWHFRLGSRILAAGPAHTDSTPISGRCVNRNARSCGRLRMCRTRALRELATWLRDGRGGLYVVAGDPGSDKSASLGRLIALTDTHR